MSVRKGYLYALFVALGIFLWTSVADAWEQAPPPAQQQTVEAVAAPWTSSEALYACSMKAEELGLTLERMHTAADVLQTSLVLAGSRENLQQFYSWLESEGRFRQIRSFQLESADETASRLSLSVQL